jgi:tRNA (mo5U34)-methyltransferase
MAGLAEDLRTEIDRIQWYHEFDFGNGLKTKAVAAYPDLWSMTTRFLDKVDFKGKSVLDIGCWDGYWSFYAERRGAAYVLATDMNNQRWSELKDGKLKPADEHANDGFRIAHRIYNSKVEYRGNVSVYDVAELGRRFDIVLFLGVLYHLTHPMYAITQIRHALKTGGEMILESGAVIDQQRSFMEYYYGYEGNEPYRVVDPSNWVMPSCRCMKDMARANYFEVVDEDHLVHPAAAPVEDPGAPRGLDGIVQKTVKGLARRYSVPLKSDVRYGRMLVRAKAVEQRDDNHLYQPLFGLHQYDPRFRKA